MTTDASAGGRGHGQLRAGALLRERAACAVAVGSPRCLSREAPLPLPACWTRRSGSCESSIGARHSTQANAPVRRHAAAAADRRRARLSHVPPEATRGPLRPLPPASSQLGRVCSAQPATCVCHRRGGEGSVRLSRPAECDAALGGATCRPCRPACRCAEFGPRGPSCATHVVLGRRVVARLLGAHRAASRPVEADWQRRGGSNSSFKFRLNVELGVTCAPDGPPDEGTARGSATSW